MIAYLNHIRKLAKSKSAINCEELIQLTKGSYQLHPMTFVACICLNIIKIKKGRLKWKMKRPNDKMVTAITRVTNELIELSKSTTDAKK